MASGAIDDLRAHRSGRVFRVEVGGAAAHDEDWARGVPGVIAVHPAEERGHPGLVVELDQTADEQRLLDAARATGPVRTFATVTPTLAELFREVVAA